MVRRAIQVKQLQRRPGSRVLAQGSQAFPSGAGSRIEPAHIGQVMVEGLGFPPQKGHLVQHQPPLPLAQLVLNGCRHDPGLNLQLLVKSLQLVLHFQAVEDGGKHQQDPPHDPGKAAGQATAAVVKHQGSRPSCRSLLPQVRLKGVCQGNPVPAQPWERMLVFSSFHLHRHPLETAFMGSLLERLCAAGTPGHTPIPANLGPPPLLTVAATAAPTQPRHCSPAHSPIPTPPARSGPD
jgi:hypothetical protein